MKAQGRAGGLPHLVEGLDVVKVSVGEQNRFDGRALDGGEDALRLGGRVNDDAFPAVGE